MSEYFIIMSIILELSQISAHDNPPHLYGLTLHLNSLSFKDDIVLIPAMKDVKVTLYGYNLSRVDSVSFTSINASVFTMCDNLRSTTAFPIVHEHEFAHALINLRPFVGNEKFFYICLSQKLNTTNNHSALIWHHQGFDKELIVTVFDNILPIWMMVILVLFLFALSGLFSGLNLGLMSLSINDLHLFIAAGSPSEKKYASIIAPVRNHGNFLLATLLLGNVLANSTLAILVEDITGSGVVAIVGSTLGIVILGEIIPQSVTSRYALVVGAKTMWITKFFMVVTFVLSFPIGKILDKLLGKELGVVYSREKLEILVKQQVRLSWLR